MDIQERWELVTKKGKEYLCWDKVQNKKSSRRDLHAFILLNELFPGTGDMVCGAGHDEIWLDVDFEQIETLTDEQILELSYCGVRCDEHGLCMFA